MIQKNGKYDTDHRRTEKHMNQFTSSQWWSRYWVDNYHGVVSKLDTLFIFLMPISKK